MRILHVISSPASGGAEVYVKDLVLELKCLGHDVFLGFLGHASDIGRCQEYEKLFLSELDSSGIPYFFIGNEARKKPWLGVWRVRNYVKNNSIDMYHTHLPYGIAFSALLKIPCVYTHHSIAPEMKPLHYFLFNKLVDRYVGISKKCTYKLQGYTGKSVVTIQNGADINKLIKIDPVLYSQREGKVQAIAVGRINHLKNYNFMIDVINRLPKNILSKFCLNIAGEGTKEETSQLLEKIKNNGLSDVVKLLGNRSDIPVLLNDSDFFLMSSTSEGLPIALIEATSTGLPCLVTDVGGCSEVIEICENGFFVAANDLDKYLDKLLELINNKKLRAELSANAIANSNTFSIENSANDHESLYRQLLARG